MRSTKMALAKILLIWDIEFNWDGLDLKAVFCDSVGIDMSVS
jgi:hypothetical protein